MRAEDPEGIGILSRKKRIGAGIEIRDGLRFRRWRWRCGRFAIFGRQVNSPFETRAKQEIEGRPGLNLIV